MGVCEVNNLIFVMGGGGIKCNLSSCEILNVKSNIWEKIDDLIVARHALSAISLNSKIYVVGGWIAGTISANNVESFDIETKIWTQLASIIVPRRLHGITYLGNYLYIFGGQTTYGVIDDVECYDI